MTKHKYSYFCLNKLVRWSNRTRQTLQHHQTSLKCPSTHLSHHPSQQGQAEAQGGEDEAQQEIVEYLSLLLLQADGEHTLVVPSPVTQGPRHLYPQSCPHWPHCPHCPPVPTVLTVLLSPLSSLSSLSPLSSLFLLSSLSSLSSCPPCLQYPHCPHVLTVFMSSCPPIHQVCCPHCSHCPQCPHVLAVLLSSLLTLSHVVQGPVKKTSQSSQSSLSSCPPVILA